MHLHDFLRSRRSVRRFKPDPVEISAIERILETATHAPSAHNRQPWRFVILTKAFNKIMLSDMMASPFRRDLEMDGLPPAEVTERVEKSRARISSAPIVIVLCMDLSTLDEYPDSNRAYAERTMAIQSTANAGFAIMLAAHAEGLGAAWICAPLFAAVAVKEALRIPETWVPQALFCIGQPAEFPPPRSRRSISEVSIFI